ncbi:MAG: AMP-binding protein [Bacteroidales bacterium]|nr:AMP-binding protein [Bacteroidales bacterium]
MNPDSILHAFIKEIRVHPNTTAFKLNDSLITNSQFAQRIAPIMNELDTFPQTHVPILMENEVSTHAAMVACILTHKIIVPIFPEWSEKQRARVVSQFDAAEILTDQRMNYYYWMTVEDAVDRLDSGLIHIDENQVIAKQCVFSEKEELTFRSIEASALKSLNVVKNPLF